MEKKVIVLEPSTNTHFVEANEIDVRNIDESTMLMNINGDGIIKHGEHGTVKTESNFVLKYVQTELNPITKKLQNAFD